MILLYTTNAKKTVRFAVIGAVFCFFDCATDLEQSAAGRFEQNCEVAKRLKNLSEIDYFVIYVTSNTSK